MEGYNQPFRRDRNINGGGILIYVKEGILSGELKMTPIVEHLEGIFHEINIRKTKWLLFGGYNNCKSNISEFLNSINPTLDHYMRKLDNFILPGDFNSEINENAMKVFCETYNLKNLIKQDTCFKNPLNPSSIDVILTNREKSFHNTITVGTGLGDHHKMTVSVLKTYVPKQAPVVIKYRDYRKFDNQQFRHDLQSRLADCKETCYEDFEISFKNVLNKHAPMKSKSVRASNSPFMNKTLNKAIMTRSRLKNKFQNNPTNENKSNYNRQPK